MDNFLLSQVIVGVAGVFYLASFQFKARERVLLCIVLAAYCIAAHFFLLGKSTAGLLACVSGTRVLTGYFTRDSRLMYLFMALALGGFIWTYSTPLSFMLLASSIACTWAVFRAPDQVLRLTYMASTSLWLVHNIVIWTPGGVILEVVFLLSNVIGYWRFYLSRNAKNKTGEQANAVDA